MGSSDNQTGASGERRKKQPAMAGILSLLPGLGQVYVGYYRRGFVNVLVVGAGISLANAHQLQGLEPLFGMFISFFWLYNIIDAVRLANLYNDATAGLGPEDLSHELVLMGRRGSIGGGVILVLAGLLFLAHTAFGMPLDWLREWWPIAPVGFGGYLLWQGMRDRRK
jgi:hypothetical protein